MTVFDGISSLRCRLCRNGLLREYEVYTRDSDALGVPLAPAFFSYTSGYFYWKNSRHIAGILELAGEIPQKSKYDAHMLVFDDNASVGDLILIDGVYYRVNYAREIFSSCRILDLEGERVEGSD